jgi:hypothetical protein
MFLLHLQTSPIVQLTKKEYPCCPSQSDTIHKRQNPGRSYAFECNFRDVAMVTENVLLFVFNKDGYTSGLYKLEADCGYALLHH